MCSCRGPEPSLQLLGFSEMQTTTPLIQRARATATPCSCTLEMRKMGPAMGKDLVKVMQESEAWEMLTVSPCLRVTTPLASKAPRASGVALWAREEGQEWAKAHKGSCMSSVAEAGEAKGKKEGVE